MWALLLIIMPGNRA